MSNQKKLTDKGFDFINQMKENELVSPSKSKSTQGGVDKVKIALAVLAVVGLLVVAKLLFGIVATILGFIFAVLTFPFAHPVIFLALAALYIVYRVTRSKN